MADTKIEELKEQIKNYEQNANNLLKENNKLKRQTSGINEKCSELEMFQGLIEKLQIKNNTNLKNKKNLLKIYKYFLIILSCLSITANVLIYLAVFFGYIIMPEIAIINFISVLNVLINGYLIINKIPNTSKLVKKYEHIVKINKKLFNDDIYNIRKCKKMNRELKNEQVKIDKQKNENREKFVNILLQINRLKTMNNKFEIDEEGNVFNDVLQNNLELMEHSFAKVKK